MMGTTTTRLPSSIQVYLRDIRTDFPALLRPLAVIDDWSARSTVWSMETAPGVPSSPWILHSIHCLLARSRRDQAINNLNLCILKHDDDIKKPWLSCCGKPPLRLRGWEISGLPRCMSVCRNQNKNSGYNRLGLQF